MKDPLPLGRLSSVVSSRALLYRVATGKTPLRGVYGTFDETGLVREATDDEKTATARRHQGNATFD
ncbi:MAG: hypothetical protein HOV81_11870, partial [Kofleriaceae bacterium]|nr:hypothetical protein [Kofleriaceae bacterium]